MTSSVSSSLSGLGKLMGKSSVASAPSGAHSVRKSMSGPPAFLTSASEGLSKANEVASTANRIATAAPVLGAGKPSPNIPVAVPVQRNSAAPKGPAQPAQAPQAQQARREASMYRRMMGQFARAQAQANVVAAPYRQLSHQARYAQAIADQNRNEIAQQYQNSIDGTVSPAMAATLMENPGGVSDLNSAYAFQYRPTTANAVRGQAMYEFNNLAGLNAAERRLKSAGRKTVDAMIHEKERIEQGHFPFVLMIVVILILVLVFDHFVHTFLEDWQRGAIILVIICYFLGKIFIPRKKAPAQEQLIDSPATPSNAAIV